MWNWLKHAFAVDVEEAATPTARQAEIVDRLCHEVVRRQLTTPALMALELSRPLNFVTAQAIHFFEPIVATIAPGDGPRELAAFLERRGAIEHLARRIEQFEADALRGRRDDDHSPSDSATSAR